MAHKFPPRLEELKENFDFLDQPSDRYEYIVDLGRSLPPLPESEKNDENKVQGCMSSVWMIAHREDAAHAPLKIQADSDSLIVKGLITILLSAIAEMSPKQILEFDANELFKQFSLDEHLSANRRNGLFAMVKRIRSFATDAVKSL